MYQKTKYYSYNIGNLPEGCRQCVKGQKTVLFITGLCSLHCFYCPISDKKKDKDVIYFNEWKSFDINDLFKEIELCNSKGVGITGGDPLMKLDRVVKFIKALKKKFGGKDGNKFHIHLYTPLNLVTKKTLVQLHKAGLDEIRFHPDLYDDKLWNRLNLGRGIDPKKNKKNKFKWKVGVEIPVIPGINNNYLKLIDYLAAGNKNNSRQSWKIDFLNLNELEISDTNACKLVEKGFKAKDRYSYGVKGSEKLAKELLKYIDKINKNITANKNKLNVHYCTCKLKDGVQLRNRIKRRAKNAAKEYDYIDEDGMLVRGAVYYDNIDDLKQILKILDKYNVPNKLYKFDKKQKRVLTTLTVVDKLKNELNKHGKPAIVREYPTVDCMNVETEFL
ncbi:MAG: radical SAM protein [Candidatus Woesearchaeota archaeon]